MTYNANNGWLTKRHAMDDGKKTQVAPFTNMV